MPVILPYNPSEKQKLFHQDKHFCKVLLCGVGFGKTTAAVFESLRKAMFDYPGKVGMMCAPTYKLLMQGLYQTWEEIVPKDWYKFDQTKGRMVMKNGSIILWRTTSNKEFLRGPSCAWVAFDEASAETDLGVYLELVNRLRDPDPSVKPQIFITTTPNGYNWIPEVFGSGPHSPGFSGTKDCWFNDKTIVIRATTMDNPAFPVGSDYYNNLISRAESSPEWVAQNVYAEFTVKAGLIFPHFKVMQHTIDKLPDNIKKYYGSFDYGYTAPSCLLTIGETADRKVIICNEEYLKDLTWDENGWFKNFKKQKETYGTDIVIVDHAHPERIAASNKYFNQKPRFLPSTKQMDDSINRVRKLFIENRLLIHSSCKNTIREFQTWSWKIDKQGRSLEVPESGNDHALDTIRYFAMFLDQNFYSPTNKTIRTNTYTLGSYA